MSGHREPPGPNYPRQGSEPPEKDTSTPKRDKPPDRDETESDVIDVDDPIYKPFVDILGRELFIKLMSPSQPAAGEASTSQARVMPPTSVGKIPQSPATQATVSGTSSTPTVTHRRNKSELETQPRASSSKEPPTGHEKSKSMYPKTTAPSATTSASDITMPVDVPRITAMMIDLLGQDIFERYMLASLAKLEVPPSQLQLPSDVTESSEEEMFSHEMAHAEINRQESETKPTFATTSISQESIPALFNIRYDASTSSFYVATPESHRTSEPSDTDSSSSGSSFYDARSTITDEETPESESPLALESITTSTSSDVSQDGNITPTTSESDFEPLATITVPDSSATQSSPETVRTVKPISDFYYVPTRRVVKSSEEQTPPSVGATPDPELPVSMENLSIIETPTTVVPTSGDLSLPQIKPAEHIESHVSSTSASESFRPPSPVVPSKVAFIPGRPVTTSEKGSEDKSSSQSTHIQTAKLPSHEIPTVKSAETPVLIKPKSILTKSTQPVISTIDTLSTSTEESFLAEQGDSELLDERRANVNRRASHDFYYQCSKSREVAKDIRTSCSKPTVQPKSDEHIPSSKEPTKSSETLTSHEIATALLDATLFAVEKGTETPSTSAIVVPTTSGAVSVPPVPLGEELSSLLMEKLAIATCTSTPSSSTLIPEALKDEVPLRTDEAKPSTREIGIQSVADEISSSSSSTTIKAATDEPQLTDNTTGATSATSLEVMIDEYSSSSSTDVSTPSTSQTTMKAITDIVSELLGEVTTLPSQTPIEDVTEKPSLSTYQATPTPSKTTITAVAGEHLVLIDEEPASTNGTTIKASTEELSNEATPSTSCTTIEPVTEELPLLTHQETSDATEMSVQQIADRLTNRFMNQGVTDFDYLSPQMLRISSNCSLTELIEGCSKSVKVFNELRARRARRMTYAQHAISERACSTFEAMGLDQREQGSISGELREVSNFMITPGDKKALRRCNSEPALPRRVKVIDTKLTSLFRFVTRIHSEARLDLWEFWITADEPVKSLATHYIESDHSRDEDNLESTASGTEVTSPPRKGPQRYLEVSEGLLGRCCFRDCINPIDSNVLHDCIYCGLRFCAVHSPEYIHGCLGPIKPDKSGADAHRTHMDTIRTEASTSASASASTSAFTSEDFKYAPAFDVMDANGNGKRGLPKLRDIIRRQREDSDCGGTDSPDLDFIYDDTDTPANEIAELYSYTEQPELQLNVKAFEDQMEQYNLLPSWQRLSLFQKKSIVMKLLDQLEISSKPLRMRAARCILYMAQGCWAEMQSDTEQQHWSKVNCMLLYDLGIFSAFTDLLNIEIENIAAAHVAIRKLAVSLADSQDLRVILSVLYTITEVIRNEQVSESTEYASQVESFCADIANATGDDLMVIKLLGMVTRFCSGVAPHFPMKKVLLLLWKLILVSLGGMETLRKMKAEKRMKADLPPQDEDTMEIARTMRASSPPASASDLLETQNQKRNNRLFRRSLIKQSSLDDHESLGMELDSGMADGNGDEVVELSEYDERRPTDNGESQMYNYQHRPSTPTPVPLPMARGLPWKPKVRRKDIDAFLESARMKFVGYALHADRDSLAGLPQPIHEGVRTLKEHMYTSLAELQIQKEEEIARNPLSTKEDDIDMTPTEILYQAMLPNLPQYMIALLKILLAAAPTSKAKTDSINIMADVLPEEMPMTVVQSMKLGLDVNRHKEIIVKAVSAILLLLLKHFKLNHIYQFEFMSQHLVFANCIPLVLKFFNQNIMGYVGATNMIPILDFPSCVIGDQPELTAESLEIGYAAPYSWRNIYSCINLLRILNKLTKWKHSRIMMLVVFKSAPILKRTLKVRHAMTQLYVLKLLKMQTKYLGRQWRKSNMKTISAIYAKVRHRLNDDWAFGNDLDARPWDFQGEECALRACVDRFNNRRYSHHLKDSDYEPVDNCLNSVLGDTDDLSENFKRHYKLWLEQEVYNVSIEWDKLLD